MRKLSRNEFKELGWRVTKIRTAIINLLSSRTQPLTAQEVIEGLKRQGSTADRATVYRDLALFLNRGVIQTIELGDDKKRYELTARGHHHHLICKSCEKIEDVTPTAALEAEEEKIMRNKNFKVLQHSLEFYGVCESCQVKK